LLSLCSQHGLDDIEALADEIIDRSEAATRATIREPGRHLSRQPSGLADGSRIDIVCAITSTPISVRSCRPRGRRAPARTASTW
jgi:hypothetical protein